MMPKLPEQLFYEMTVAGHRAAKGFPQWDEAAAWDCIKAAFAVVEAKGYRLVLQQNDPPAP